MILNSRGALQVALGASVKPTLGAAADAAVQAVHTKELDKGKA